MSRVGPALVFTRSGYAVAKFSGKTLRFGRNDDPETRTRFLEFKLSWEKAGRKLTESVLASRSSPTRRTTHGLTVAALAARYLAHLKEKNSPQWIRNNMARYRLSLAPLTDLCGKESARSFGPLRLQAVRDSMVRGGSLCRKEVNRRIQIVRGCFRWGVSQELLPGDLVHGLASVEGLRAGDHGLDEGRAVLPVSREDVEAVLPHLLGPVAALVEVLYWTGARPSELFKLTARDIDRSGPVWVARLTKHKNAHRGQAREVFFGPKAQAVIEPLLLRPEDRPLFSPKDAVAEQQRRRRSERKTPLYDAHVRRYERDKRGRPELAVGDHYTASTLRQAVLRGISHENRRRRREAVKAGLTEWTSLDPWTPGRLRHSAATRLRKELGLDPARAVLGHTSANTTEIYAELDRESAKRAMERAG